MAPANISAQQSNMKSTLPSGATPYNVQLSTEHSPGYTHVEGLTRESADTASDLLMLNHAKYHTYFHKQVGLHNHIVHQLCTLWALGASPAEMQTAYDLNKTFQLPHFHHNAETLVKMRDPAFFRECLGKSEFYNDYLHFFQDEIAERGAEEVLKEYVFKGDERADDMLGRMHSGFLHPIIHLGFSLEFNQPCLVAESLAGACVHDNWPLPILLSIEQHLSSHPDTPRKSMLSILQTLQTDPIFAAAAKTGAVLNRVTDALIPHAGPQLSSLLAQWRVEPTQEDIAYKTAEMANLCAYTLAAAQHPAKEPAMDFFMMHSVNLGVFYPVFMRLHWLTLEQKARLLNWKGWMDLVIYAACACPTLYLDRVTDYKPKAPGGWDNVVSRAIRYPDDGHTAKLIRALIGARNLSASHTANPELPLAQKDFLQIAHMTMDSVERMQDPGYKVPEKLSKFYGEALGYEDEVVRVVARWVRWPGIEGAWDDFPDLEARARL